MKTKKLLCSLAIILSGTLILISSAIAVTPNPECVQDAKNEKNLCVAKCQEEFRVDKDACRNVDHDCADACREGFETCVEPFLTKLATDKADCLATLEAAKVTCRGLYGAGTQERDTCIDQAQLVTFACRDLARENVASGLIACRDAFRTCIKACPPPVAP
jgi:hypothetical protein